MSRRLCRLAPLGVMLTVALLFGLMSLWTPQQLDDYTFINEYHSWSGGSDSFSLSAWLSYCDVLRTCDNMRFANLLSPFSTIIEPWCSLFPWLTGITVAIILAIILKWGRARRHRGLFAVLVWAAMTAFPAWYNSLFVADYLLNYVYATAITLLTLAAIIHCERRRLWSPLRFAAVALLTCIAAGWHEQFAFSAVAGLGLWIIACLARRRPVSAQLWLITILYFGVALAVFLCPGMIDRIGRETGANAVIDVRRICFDLMLAFAALAALAVACRRRDMRRRLMADPLAVVTLGMMLASSALNFMATHSPRMAFLPVICAIILLLRIVGPALARLAGRRRLIFGAVAWTLYAACCLQMVAALVWEYDIWQQHRRVIAQLDADPGRSTVFEDIVGPYDPPYYTLYFPSRTIWISPYTLERLGQKYGHECIAVVPWELSDATPANSEPLEGNLGIFRRSDHLWAPGFPGRPEIYTAPADITVGSDVVRREMVAMRFKPLRGDSIYHVFFLRADSRAVIAVIPAQSR